MGFLERVGRMYNDSLNGLIVIAPKIFLAFLLVGTLVVSGANQFFTWNLFTLIGLVYYAMGWSLIGVMSVYNDNVGRYQKVDYSIFRGFFLLIGFLLSLIIVLVCLFSLHWIAGTIFLTFLVLSGIILTLLTHRPEQE